MKQLLFIIVGWAPWMLINAVYSQLSRYFAKDVILHGFTPDVIEKLSSSMSITIQMANIWLITPLICKSVSTETMIPTLTIIGTITAIVYSLFWSYATAFFCIVFAAGSIGVLSNIYIWSWAASDRRDGDLNVTSVGIGMSLSSAIPALIILLQQPASNDNLLFDVNIFALIIAVTMLMSTASVFSLNHTMKIESKRYRELDEADDDMKLFLNDQQLRLYKVMNDVEENSNLIDYNNNNSDNNNMDSDLEEEQSHRRWIEYIKCFSIYSIFPPRNFHMYMIQFFGSALDFATMSLSTVFIKTSTRNLIVDNSSYTLEIFTIVGMLSSVAGRLVASFAIGKNDSLVVNYFLFAAHFLFFMGMCGCSFLSHGPLPITRDDSKSHLSSNQIILIIFNGMVSVCFSLQNSLLYKSAASQEKLGRHQNVSSKRLARNLGIVEQLGALISTTSIFCALEYFSA